MMTANKSLYQLYEITDEGCASVEVHIGQSKDLPYWPMKKYAVNVCCIKKRDNEITIENKETELQGAWKAPNWNANFKFYMSKTELSNCELKFELKETRLFRSDYVDTVKHNIKDIENITTVFFKERKQIDVTVKTCQDLSHDVIIRNSTTLCDAEKKFYNKRRDLIENSMAKLKVEGGVPNIAVIGSGGGLRAVIGMCGAMTALQNENLLDYAMYTAGVSGSSWYIAELYAASKDKLNPKEVKQSIKTHIPVTKESPFLFALRHAKGFHPSNIEHNTLADMFGNVVSHILGESSKSKWTYQREKINNAVVPLPLLAAVHVRKRESIKHFNEWVEFSPYEVFMPKYGAGIDMENFGSKFNAGCMTTQLEEPYLHFLQGICGSAYGKYKDDVATLEEGPDKRKLELQVDSMLGKVPNWLYDMVNIKRLFGEDDELPKCMTGIIDTKDDEFITTDAGLVFNSPYPLVLHPARHVDLILSFEFSAPDKDNWPFSELDKAADWARIRKIPFPNLTEGKKGNYKRLYLFESPNTPTIMHFVLLHADDIDKPPGADVPAKTKKDVFEKFETLKFDYTHEEFDFLSNLVESSVTENADEIKKCITEAIRKRADN